MEPEYVNRHWFKLNIATEAGTYVKEFVTGDYGRTKPNVATMIGLGGKCDILQLDCVGMKLED